MFKSIPLFPMICSALTVVALASECLAAASATAGTSFWRERFSNDDTDSNWYSENGDWKKATIDWVVGPLKGGAATLPQFKITEAKFATPVTPFEGDSPHRYTGVNSSVGTLTTGLANAWGTGKSGSTALTYKAEWEVHAGGIYQSHPTATTYDSKIVAKDPWPIMPDALDDHTSLNYDLYANLSVISGSSVGSGSHADGTPFESGFGYSVSYETASSTVEVLDIVVNGADVVVERGAADGIAFFRLDDSGDPTTRPEDALTPSQIQTLLLADLADNMAIDTPLHIGILLDDIPRPTVPFGEDGQLALVHVDSFASAHNAVPEPATLALLAVGALGTFRRARRRWVD